MNRTDASQDVVFGSEFTGSQVPNATVRDASVQQNALSAQIDRGARAGLIAQLAAALRDAAAAGDLDAARVVHEAIARLLVQ